MKNEEEMKKRKNQKRKGKENEKKKKPTFASDSVLIESNVAGILQEALRVCADVNGDGKTSFRRDASTGGVQRQLSNRDSHPIGSQISKTKNPLAVSHHNHSHATVRPVLQDLPYSKKGKRKDKKEQKKE